VLCGGHAQGSRPEHVHLRDQHGATKQVNDFRNPFGASEITLTVIVILIRVSIIIGLQIDWNFLVADLLGGAATRRGWCRRRIVIHIRKVIDNSRAAARGSSTAASTSSSASPSAASSAHRCPNNNFFLLFLIIIVVIVFRWLIARVVVIVQVHLVGVWRRRLVLDFARTVAAHR
jgi:hypothetical protein